MKPEKNLAQFCEGTMSANPRRPSRTAENVTHLLIRQFREAGQQQHLPVIVCQFGEGYVQQCSVVLSRRSVPGVGRRVSMASEIHRIHCLRNPLGLLEFAYPTLSGDPVHPGTKLAVIPVGVSILQHSMEDGLQDILSCDAIAGQPQEKSIKTAMMPLEQYAECRYVPFPNCNHQGVVRPRFYADYWVVGTVRHVRHGKLNADERIFERSNHGMAWLG